MYDIITAGGITELIANVVIYLTANPTHSPIGNPSFIPGKGYIQSVGLVF